MTLSYRLRSHLAVLAINYYIKPHLFFNRNLRNIRNKNLLILSFQGSRAYHNEGSPNTDVGLNNQKLMPKTPVVNEVESKWYDWWEENNYFKGTSTDKKFVMLLPPPNVTGKLHMGHALTCSIQDAIVRWHIMNGYEVLWIPGYDHAGIATQVVVEQNLIKTKKMSKDDLGREKFLEEVHLWTKEKGHTIKMQMRRLGVALDWKRSTFTLDPKINTAVIEAVRRLHQDGLLYRSNMPINWCSMLQSAISDSEVDHILISSPTKRLVPGHKNAIEFGYMYDISFRIKNSNDRITVSTTRPETVLGDTAIMVHPDDPRYKHLHGCSALHPFSERLLPIVTDEQVDMNLGTGAVKVTPGHSFQDFQVAKRHNLQIVEILDDRGCIVGIDAIKGKPRFTARTWVLNELSNQGLYESKRPHSLSIPVCSRTGDVIEPRLKPQWFVKMDAMSKAAHKAVQEGHLRIHPPSAATVLSNFLIESRDWCISRQLWWGHRMPVYWASSRKQSKYGDEQEMKLEESVFVVAASESEAYKEAALKLAVKTSDIKTLVEDRDVLDTWFSSGLLPLAVFGWPGSSPDLDLNYPSSLLETGHDILFFWVARMVMMGLQFTGQLPFKDVLLHALVCDSEGHKMSKSKGNVVDPIDIIEGYQKTVTTKKGSTSTVDFPAYGSDSLRMALLTRDFKQSTLPFDTHLVQQNHLFRNKMWQTVRFLIQNVEKISEGQKWMKPIGKKSVDNLMDAWILSRLASTIMIANEGFRSYALNESASSWKSFWHSQFCDVYMEAVKPRLWNLDDSESAKSCASVLFTCCHSGIVGISPFMPFITEELYQYLPTAESKRESIMQCPYPSFAEFSHFKNEELEREMNIILNVFTSLRSLRNSLNIKTKVPQGKATIYIGDDDVRSTANQLVEEGLRLCFLKELCFRPLQEMPDVTDLRSIRHNVEHDVLLDFSIPDNINLDSEISRLSRKLKKLREKLQNASRNLEKLESSPVYSERNKSSVENQISDLETDLKNIEIFIEAVGNCK